MWKLLWSSFQPAEWLFVVLKVKLAVEVLWRRSGNCCGAAFSQHSDCSVVLAVLLCTVLRGFLGWYAVSN